MICAGGFIIWGGMLMAYWNIESLGVDYWNDRQTQYSEQNQVYDGENKLDSM